MEARWSPWDGGQAELSGTSVGLDRNEGKMGRKTINSAENAAKVAVETIDRMRRSPFDRLSNGNDAWSQLQAAARSGSKRGDRNLDDQDFIAIASQAWVVFEQHKAKIISKYTLTAFTQMAFGSHHTSSKELSVVLLPPGEDFTKRGMRKNIRSYYQLIKGMEAATGQSPSRLAETILRGTKLDPLTHIDSGTMSMLEKVQVMLQSIVNKVDEEFGLLRLYQETAKAKVESIHKGSSVNWPLRDLEAPTDDSEYVLQTYRQEREAASDPSQAFWRVGEHFGYSRNIAHVAVGEIGVIRTDSFFFVPHACFGYVLVWDLPDRRDDPVLFDAALANQIKEIKAKKHYIDVEMSPRDNWDLSLKCPTGQTDPNEGNSLQYNFWLVVYPDPTGTRLEPCLFMPSAEEGCPYLVPICLETLLMLQRVYWISKDECKPAFDRLVELLSEQNAKGESTLLDNLRRTASWLQYNPVLKEKARNTEREQKLNIAFKALVGASSKPNSIQD
jgi:hypothetical protein